MTEQQNSPGWATYLRVSDEDKQTPERSFAMQRQRIQEQLLIPSGLKFKREYTDMLTGTSPNRKDYQQMLADAEAGRFSHLGLYRADRFGRNAVEGLQSATKLISLGIKVRVANMPTLTPEVPDGFFMFLIQMGLAQREVDVLRQRTADGMEAKLRAGGWVQKAPDGYVNKERQVSSNKYERWVEKDPEYNQVIREAWDLLLTSRYTLEQICEKLLARGYTRASGRPWAWNDLKTGTRRYGKSLLHKIYHKPFYAGWVVSERFGIKMGEVRGQWEPTVSTAEYERGVEILHEHDAKKSRFKKRFYLLRQVLWVRVNGKEYKMYGSTPSGRSRSYAYYITHAKPNGESIHISCDTVDDQIKAWLTGLTIDPGKIPAIRDVYVNEIKQVTVKDHDEELAQLQHRFVQLKEEEAHLVRLLITNKVSEEVYERLRAEWQEKLRRVELNIADLQRETKIQLDDLDAALILMAKLSFLFSRLSGKKQALLLQIIAKRIIVNPDGEIIDYKLNSPFMYIWSIAEVFRDLDSSRRGSEQVHVGAQVIKDRSSDEVERFLFVWRSEERYTHNSL